LPSPRMFVAICLIAIGAALAGANVWFAAARSTIPLALDTIVIRKEIRQEKHPPKDNVCLLHTSSQRVLHVDSDVFEAVREDERLLKEAWSQKLVSGTQQVALNYSADLRGMLVAMPSAFSVLVVVAAISLRLTGIGLHSAAKQT
jgi:hypothetical protein